jgi:predicted phosphodiesterase
MRKIDLCRTYRDKYGMSMPTLKLARIVYKDNPLLFKNVEDARTSLRQIEGKAGPTFRVTHKIENRPKNPYNLPDSYQENKEPFLLPKESNNILVISDLHIPYHDIDSVTLAIEYGMEHKVNTIFINGDLMDFYNASRFEKDPGKRSIKQEFDAAKQFLKSLREVFPEARIYWLKGNHDMRYEKFLLTKVYEIFDDPYYSLENRLRLNEEKIVLINDNILVKAGKLSISHGHHIIKGVFSPVNSARGAWLKAKQSLLIGHVHKVSTHVEVNLDGLTFGCWSTGSLCQLKPDYNPLVSNYQHGFAHVTVDPDGDFQVKNYQIINGKIH